MSDADSDPGNTDPAHAGSLGRAFALLRELAAAPPEGARVTQIAKAQGLTQATAHRLLQALIVEGMVEQDARSRLYRLSLDLFSLAARAGDAMNLRSLCRPALLRLCASIGDTTFLLVRSGFDAVCVDRCEGPFVIRTFTGDVGGRVALGVGQAATAILSHLPEAERDEVIRYNLPRLRERGVPDEVYLRTEIERTRRDGYASCNAGLIEGMAGVGVAILDREGRAIAALSVGTIADRLNAERLPMVGRMLQREAQRLSLQINPFDATLRRPAQSLGGR
jgi:DNA-binding IclR family transcriptional regulator